MMLKALKIYGPFTLVNIIFLSFMFTLFSFPFSLCIDTFREKHSVGGGGGSVDEFLLLNHGHPSDFMEYEGPYLNSFCSFILYT